MRSGDSPARNKMLARQKVERVEHDRFSQRDRENRVHKHGRERAGIATDRGRHSETGQADSDSYTHRGEADVNASAHFC